MSEVIHYIGYQSYSYFPSLFTESIQVIVSFFQRFLQILGHQTLSSSVLLHDRISQSNDFPGYFQVEIGVH